MTIHRSQSRADRHLLARQYPEAFAETGGGQIKRPLKRDIADDLIRLGVLDQQGNYLPVRRIIEAVQIYTQGPKYLAALAAGGSRYDLQGHPCGEVSPEEQARAMDKLKVRGWDRFFDQDGAPLSHPKRRAA